MAQSENGVVSYTSAGGVVVNEGGDQVLVLVRPERDEVRLPKGHIEDSESAADTALREVREEAGYRDLEILADLGEQLVVFLLEGKTVRRTERYFLLRARTLARSEQPPGDAAQFFPVWLPWQQVPEHLTFEAEREWIRRAEAAWESQS